MKYSTCLKHTAFCLRSLLSDLRCLLCVKDLSVFGDRLPNSRDGPGVHSGDAQLRLIRVQSHPHLPGNSRSADEHWHKHSSWSYHVSIRDESILGIPMGPVGPMGIPWEWESLS